MLSKISGDAGHNCSPDVGSTGYRKEDDLTKEVWHLIQKKLKALNIKVVDCTPYNKELNSVKESLAYRIMVANVYNTQLHLSIHFNSGRGNGTECWIKEMGGQVQAFAENILKEISLLGYENRGIKVGNMYMTKYTKMPCIVIECAFIDSKEDMLIYDSDKLATAIVKAITGRVVLENDLK